MLIDQNEENDIKNKIKKDKDGIVTWNWNYVKIWIE